MTRCGSFITIFTGESHVVRIFTARRYASTVYAVVVSHVCPSVRPSICLSVRHKSVFYQDG